MLEGRMMRLHLCLGASSAAVWGLPGRGWWEDCESCRKLLLAFGQIAKRSWTKVTWSWREEHLADTWRGLEGQGAGVTQGLGATWLGSQLDGAVVPCRKP